jgi:NAD(P)-dependent dehydrogenase (short-subunit alcohol dehydrogenase family)
MGQVEGKVAIVTGGASGIGAACAATLAREGAKVVITDIDDAGAQAVVGKIVAAGGEAICLHQDVSIEEEWPGVIEATERRFGQLNVMMANAGIGILCKAIEMSLANWRRQTAINLDGVFLSGEIRCSSDAPGRRRLDHHHVVGCRSSRIGRVGRLLRDQRRRAPVRQSRRNGVRGRRRRDPDQHGASRGHRYTDLDQDLEFHGPQHANRPK